MLACPGHSTCSITSNACIVAINFLILAPGQVLTRTRIVDDNPDRDLDLTNQTTALTKGKRMLARETGKFAQYTEDLKSWTGRVKGTEAKNDQELKKKQRAAVESEAETRFPGRQVDEVSHGLAFAGGARDNFCVKRELSTEACLEVFFANLQIPGTDAYAEMLKALGGIAPVMKEKAAKTCLIVVAPNVGMADSSDVYSEEAIEAHEQKILQALKDTELRLSVKEFILHFDPSSIPSDCDRFSYQKCWICVSDSKGEGLKDEALLSEFVKCHLYKRRVAPCVTQVTFPTESEFVDPRTSKSGVLNRSQLSVSSQRKQWTTGPSVMQGIAECLWHGMNLDKDTAALWIDVFAYDISLAEMVMMTDNLPKWPTQLVASIMWSKLGLEDEATPTDPARKRRKTDTSEEAKLVFATNTGIAQWHARRTQTKLYDLAEQRVVNVKDFRYTPTSTSADSNSRVGEATRPVFDVSEYELLYPTAGDKSLPIRASALAKMEATLKDEKLLKEWTDVVAEHDKKHNPTKLPYDDLAPTQKKHDTPSTAGATIMTAKPKGPADKAALEKISGGKNKVKEFQRGKLTVYVTAKGGIWAKALEDHQLLPPDATPQSPAVLMLVFGTFHDDDDKYLKNNPSAMLVGFNQDTETALFRTEAGGIESGQHMSLHSFLEELENTHKVDINTLDFPPHESVSVHVTQNGEGDPDGKEFKITKAADQCCFEPLIGRKFLEADWEDMGSVAVIEDGDWDMKSGLHKAGFLKLASRFYFMDNSQGKTLAPEKPAIVAAKPMQFKKDILVHLAGPE